VTHAAFVASALIAASAGFGSVQDSQTVAPPAQQLPQVAPAPAPPAAPSTPLPPVSPERRRQQIGIMENILTATVRIGADEAARQMQANIPSLAMTTGSAHARGFNLEGYGVFFDVEIPTLAGGVLWTAETLIRDRDTQWVAALNAMKTQLEQSLPEGARPQLVDAMQRMNRTISPTRPAGTALTNEAAADIYTESVKTALLDALVDYSGPMGIRPEESMTIAARAIQGTPVQPGEVSVTITFRIRGTDLAEFAAGRITRDEMKKRVEVREF
jgi:hypothetical protein